MNAGVESTRQFRTILVAVADPSARRQPAVERGAQLAEATGARLVLFHAAFDPALSGRPFFDSTRLAKSRGALVAERTRLLERRASGLRGHGLSVDIGVVWEEPAHEAIIRATLREKADLVIAGRHESRANAPAQFRLTDWELMRLCPRPLLVTHPERDAEPAAAAVLAALDPTHSNDKTASLDASIVSYATAIAAALGVGCHAVHSVPVSAYPLSEVTPAQRARLDRRMYSRVKQLMGTVDADAVHIVHGNVAESLPKLARKLRAQVLVMGIVSRRWMKRFVIGDSAETVVRQVPCDLLLIKPDGFRLRLGRVRKEPLA
jgi:universal stress protein E